MYLADIQPNPWRYNTKSCLGFAARAWWSFSSFLQKVVRLEHVQGPWASGSNKTVMWVACLPLHSCLQTCQENTRVQRIHHQFIFFCVHCINAGEVDWSTSLECWLHQWKSSSVGSSNVNHSAQINRSPKPQRELSHCDILFVVTSCLILSYLLFPRSLVTKLTFSSCD